MSDSIDSLRTEFARIVANAQTELTDQERHTALRELVALYRRAERVSEEMGVLQANVRELGTRLRAADRDPTVAHPTRGDRLAASTHVEKGWHLISLGDYPGAVAALGQALAVAPDDNEAGALLGWAQMLGGQLDEAMTTLQGVLARDASNALARVNVGFICLRKQIFGEAIEHLSRVIRESTDRRSMLYAHYYLGMVYLERDMFDDAIPLLHTALELGPNLVEARYELGRACWFSGRRDDALTAWELGAEGGTYSPWGTRCRELLSLVEAGGEIPRRSSV
jgi:tetratricopeptide (TPR) repeat protein